MNVYKNYQRQKPIKMNLKFLTVFVFLLCFLLCLTESKLNMDCKSKDKFIQDSGSKKLIKRSLLPEGLAFPPVRYGDIGFGK